VRESTVKFSSKPKLKEPILIGGLAGMGYVGKLAAEHLVAELHAEKFAEIYSPYFPPHVHVGENGLVRAVKDEFYWASPDGLDTIILVGDVQATSPEGHYEVAEKILDVSEQFRVKRIFTLGGYATGRYPRGRPKVIWVVSHPELLDAYRERGAMVEHGGGPIVGASGLLIGLGKARDMQGVCLLGETHGMVVDHRSAQSVLEVLSNILGIKVDMAALEHRAKETERLLTRIRREIETRARREKRKAEEELWYIG